jgi:hypothetical protein
MIMDRIIDRIMHEDTEKGSSRNAGKGEAPA